MHECARGRLRAHTHAERASALTRAHKHLFAHTLFNVLSLQTASYYLACARPRRDHYFTLEACTRRIFPSSLLSIPVFNSIIITYFIPLADWKSSWSAPQFYAWGSALDASWSLSASIIYFDPTSQTASAEKNIINTRKAFINSCDKMV